MMHNNRTRTFPSRRAAKSASGDMYRSVSSIQLNRISQSPSPRSRSPRSHVHLPENSEATIRRQNFSRSGPLLSQDLGADGLPQPGELRRGTAKSQKVNFITPTPGLSSSWNCPIRSPGESEPALQDLGLVRRGKLRMQQVFAKREAGIGGSWSSGSGSASGGNAGRDPAALSRRRSMSSLGGVHKWSNTLSASGPASSASRDASLVSSPTNPSHASTSVFDDDAALLEESESDDGSEFDNTVGDDERDDNRGDNLEVWSIVNFGEFT